MLSDTTPAPIGADAALAKLRHLYDNLANGGVRDTAQAKRIAEGLLAPAIAALERAALASAAQPADTVTVRYDLSPAATESAIRAKLIEMGWTPPDTAAPKAAPAPAAVAGFGLRTTPDSGECPWGGIYSARADAERDAEAMRSATGRAWEVVPLTEASRVTEPTTLAAPAAQGDALDAARYRWLRLCNLAKHPAVRDGFELGDAHLDAAIDTARAAKEGGADVETRPPTP